MPSPRHPLIVLALAGALSSSAQTIAWAQATGANLQEIWRDVAVGPDGSVVSIGTFQTNGTAVDLDPGAGVVGVSSNAQSYDVFFRKVDPNGNFAWGGALGGNSTDGGFSVALDTDQNVYLCGAIGGTNVDLDPTAGSLLVSTVNTGSDAFVVKLSSGGAFLWGRIFGGTGADAAMAMAVDNFGNSWITGYLGNGGDLDPGAGAASVTSNGLQDIFISKLDANGLFSWGGSVGGTGNDLGRGITMTSNGDAVVCGEFRGTADFDPGVGTLPRTSAGDADMFLMRVTTSGTVIWAQRFGGAGFETARCVASDASDNLVITGEVNSPTDMDIGTGVANLAGTFSEESFIAKLDGNCAHQWSFLLAGFINKGNGIAVGPQAEVYATGKFLGTMDVDPGPGVSNLTAASGGDGYVLRYSATGALVWAFKLDATSNMSSESIAVSTTATVAVVGTFPVGTMDVQPGAGVTNITSIGSDDAFTAVYTQVVPCNNAQVALRAMLEGPYRQVGGLMIDSLRVRGMIPLAEPYTALGLPITGASTVAPAVLAIAGANAIVDWVVVELRAAADPTVLVERRAALLQRDGDVVALGGSSPVGFCAANGNYVVALRHRNHLGVATSTHLALTSAATVIDLTLPGTPVHGTDARNNINGVMVLWQGNVVADTSVAYTGAGNDRDPILVAVGGTVPTNTASGYHPADVNLDGTVKYTGADNDRDPVLLTIGGTVPTNVRTEQLP